MVPGVLISANTAPPRVVSGQWNRWPSESKPKTIASDATLVIFPNSEAPLKLRVTNCPLSVPPDTCSLKEDTALGQPDALVVVVLVRVFVVDVVTMKLVVRVVADVRVLVVDVKVDVL